MALLLVLGLLACSSTRGGSRDAAPSKTSRPRTTAPEPPPPECTVGTAVRRLAKTEPRSLGPAIAWDGTRAIVAWVEDRGDSQGVVATRVDRDGAVEASAAAPIRLGGTAAVPPVAIAASQGGALVVYGDDRDRMGEIYARWLDAEGSPRGRERRLSDAARRDPGTKIGLIAGGARHPAALWRAGGALVAWDMPQPPRNQIFASPWPDPEAAPQEAFMVSRGPSDTESPSLALAGDRVGVSWCTGVPGRYEVLFTTVDPGTGAAGVPGAAGTAAEVRRIAETQWGPCAPALAAVGSEFLVAWVGGDEREGKVLVATVGQGSGEPSPRELGAIALRPPRSQIDRLVAMTGTDRGAVVLWAGPRPDGSGELRVALVGRDGEILTPATPVAGETRHPFDLALAPAGEDVLAVWHDGETEQEDVFFARLSCR